MKIRQKVKLTAYPNPVSGTVVSFRLKYTEYHGNMQLTVYDISGKQFAALPVATAQKTMSLNISGYAPGMYVAVVRDNRRVLGKAVFSIR